MFSDPVIGGNFFGRQEIIDLLVKRASALKSGYRQNVAIIGHQQLGKTSVLRHFLHTYRDSETLSIYVEIKLQALDYFVDQFVRSLLYQYLIQDQAISATESLQNLMVVAETKIPKTVARIKEIATLLKQRHPEDAYSKLFDLTSIIKQETGKNCIVILDEFHRLGEFGVKNAFSDFGKRIMLQKDTMYLLSSSSFSASRKILAEKLSLLFGNFERIYLENFDFQTSYRFIDKKMDGLKLGDPLKTFLVSLTDGHPFFLETITAKIYEGCKVSQAPEVTGRIIADAFYKLFYESQGVLNQYFMKLISPWTQSRSRGSHLLILTKIAGGHNRLKDVAAALNRSQKEIAGQIQELMEYELLVKTGVFYRFHNKMFKFWLKEVYEKRELSLLTVEDNKETFIQAIELMIAENEELEKLDVSARLTELLGRFQNDLIEFGEKKRKLPHFTEILESVQALDVPAGSSRGLIARGHGRCWVCKIVEERATEKEVLDLIRGDKANAPTKVLVALRGLEDNAKLLAKEKRVLTLSLSSVNLLMDLYGKSPIIRT